MVDRTDIDIDIFIKKSCTHNASYRLFPISLKYNEVKQSRSSHSLHPSH